MAGPKGRGWRAEGAAPGSACPSRQEQRPGSPRRAMAQGDTCVFRALLGARVAAAYESLKALRKGRHLPWVEVHIGR